MLRCTTRSTVGDVKMNVAFAEKLKKRKGLNIEILGPSLAQRGGSHQQNADAHFKLMCGAAYSY